MNEFNDVDFLLQVQELLEAQLGDRVKEVVLYRTRKASEFPCVVLSMQSNVDDTFAIDSSRDNNFANISLTIEVYTKVEDEKNNFIECMKIKNLVRQYIRQCENLVNLYITLDTTLPNLDSEICRWRLTYNGEVDIKNNKLI